MSLFPANDEESDVFGQSVFFLLVMFYKNIIRGINGTFMKKKELILSRYTKSAVMLLASLIKAKVLPPLKNLVPIGCLLSGHGLSYLKESGNGIQPRQS